MNATETREVIHAVLRDLNLPQGQYVVSGSAVMFLHGIDREKPIGDIDIFVATRVWFDLHAQRDMERGRDGTFPRWGVYTTEPDDPKRRCDPPYLHRTMHGVEVDVFSGWRTRHVGDIDVGLWINNAEFVDGWPCIPLFMLLDWKTAIGRSKDLADIRQIAQHLEDA